MSKKRSKQSTFMVVGNWKMNPTGYSEARDIFQDLKRSAGQWSQTLVVTAPPAVYLSGLAEYKRPSHFALAGQDCHFVEAGSHTGEISPAMLKQAGADWVILGHSERRAAGEDDRLVAQKAVAAVEQDLSVILCVGERERDEDGRYLAELEEQVLDSTQSLTEKQLTRVVMAYEPVWAIGREDNQALAGEGIYEMVIFIRRTLNKRYSRKTAVAMPVLYGGSVTPDNTSDIMRNGHVSGLLVGRQSLQPPGFKEVIDIVDSTVEGQE